MMRFCFVAVIDSNGPPRALSRRNRTSTNTTTSEFSITKSISPLLQRKLRSSVRKLFLIKNFSAPLSYFVPTVEGKTTFVTDDEFTALKDSVGPE